MTSQNTPPPPPPVEPSGQPPTDNRTRTMAFIVVGVVVILIIVAVIALTGNSSGDGTDTSSAAAGTESSESGAEVTQGIEKLQGALSVLGYYDGPIDGVYGPETTAAVSTFQADAGITVDGQYGPETNAALKAALGEEAPDLIARLQQALTDLGFYDGPIDGEYGPATEDAVKLLQESCSIPADGIYGAQTHQCLLDNLATA